MEEESQTKLQSHDPEFRHKFRTLYLQDEKPLYEIVKELGIPRGTFDNYVYTNFHGLRDFFHDVKKELILHKTEQVSRKILAFDTNTINDKKLAIQQKETEFLRETLGKDQGYSKRIETIGLNINKTEPLDKDQQDKLDRLLGIKGKKVVDVTPQNDPNVSQETPPENDPDILEVPPEHNAG